MARRREKRENPYPPGSTPAPVNIPGVRSLSIEVRRGGYKDDPDGPSLMTQERFWTAERCHNRTCSGGGIYFGSELRAQIESRLPVKGIASCRGQVTAGFCPHWVSWKGSVEYEDAGQ